MVGVLGTVVAEAAAEATSHLPRLLGTMSGGSRYSNDCTPGPVGPPAIVDDEVGVDLPCGSDRVRCCARGSRHRPNDRRPRACACRSAGRGRALAGGRPRRRTRSWDSANRPSRAVSSRCREPDRLARTLRRSRRARCGPARRGAPSGPCEEHPTSTGRRGASRPSRDTPSRNRERARPTRQRRTRRTSGTGRSSSSSST